MLPSFGQFFPVSEWEKQIYPSLSPFGRENQVLDGKTQPDIENQ